MAEINYETLATSETRNAFCTFQVAHLYFGVEVCRVQEVIRYQRMTRVPLAPPIVRGIINLRGQLVTAIDLRKRLGLPPASEDQQPMNVVVRDSEGCVSLLVDEIGDVLEVSPDQFETPPETLDGVPREIIRGVYKLDGKLLLVLDTALAVDTAA